MTTTRIWRASRSGQAANRRRRADGFPHAPLRRRKRPEESDGGYDATAVRRVRSDVLGLGECQCRYGQDARAHDARAAAAARGHCAGAHPRPHLHEGGRRRDVEARVRAPRRLGDDGRAGAVGRARRADGAGAQRRRDAARAPPVRHRDRDARRAEGADHPRLLRTAAAALLARGRRAAGLRNPR